MKSLDLAKEKLLVNNHSLVVVKDYKVIHKSDEKGLAPILSCYQEDRSIFDGASIADKVIGKAAGLILIESNIKELYAELISDRAIEILDQANISYEYNKRVPEIRNRDNTGMCPMEELALDSSSADELVEKIKEKFSK